jgi:membrane protease YdiL (CAAX protease family)
MPTWMDHLIVAGFALAWPAASFVRHRAYRAQVRARMPGARLAGYAETATTEWIFGALAVALWIRTARDWSAIGLVAPSGWRAWAAMAVALALGGLLVAQSMSVARTPQAHDQVRAAIAPVAEVLPAQPNDLKGFLALALTAGICEEILFRGLLPWYLGHALGFWGGHALALAIFGGLHGYLGATASLRALLTGIPLAGLYIWTGSLLPSMVLHALADVAGGWMGYAVLRDEPAGVEAPAV